MSLLPALPIYDVQNSNKNIRQYPVRVNPLEIYEDSEFYDRFRFRKETFSYICDLIRPSLTPKNHRACNLSPELQLCCALRFYATGTFLQAVGDLCTMDKSSASRVVTNISNLLSAKLDEFVEIPDGDNQLKSLQNGFYEVAGLPGIVGAIDGTHVKIQAPSGDQEPHYINRKGYHSINVQAICDSNGKFLNIVSDWPGSAHDSRILQMSQVGFQFANGTQKGILLGDGGYACTPWLLTPLLAPQTRAELKYNSAHKVTRSVIERTFGRWKRKFHILHGEIRLSPIKACRVIGACAVLHNIAVDKNEPVEEDWEESESDNDSDISGANGQGKTFRTNYIQKYFG